ncbi:chorion peroxidase [Cataglyphis hispanica]|uniref:chorion peroxidase n=1 Tax=Cataglyphis hispanica TaxID=1086592 RepID=UPI00218064D5|nr:chorion peroxidase [Cataglyphis hispanica]XP_050449275.1 chorion peroxidase [Cataglyphis hispanica]XP_050449276.1 chorion peroxidase [Cataglyphis hispanica]XP_050449278.1 chorion peroxidase [Cataglyphis hispanica]
MRGITERTPLRRHLDSPDYVEFASLLRTRRTRIRQFQCCVCGILIVVFTMALVVSISYSISHTNSTYPMIDNVTSSGNLGSILRGSLASTFGSATHASFSSTISAIAEPNYIPIQKANIDTSTKNLSRHEYMEGLRAGEQAMKKRLFADRIAAKSPLPSPSPESRHRYAVSTHSNVSAFALAAIGEIAATRTIENMRSIQDESSAIGTFFDSDWVPKSICKQYFDHSCKIGKYRTVDGSCNRPRGWGSSMTPFRRVLTPDYADGINSPRKARSGKELPSAREVSLKIHKPSASSNPSFTVMLAVFGQFLDHDITATALSQGINGSSIACCSVSKEQHPECFPIRIGTGDPLHDLHNRTCMDFVRSAPAPRCELGPREQLNQVSAFIDGSAIYGSNNEITRNLREFSGGRLKMQLTPDNRTLLPASTNPNDGCNREAERRHGRYCFAAGDARANENLHLTTMHLLWARQHNRIADELSKVNPAWSDEVLFQETRRIVGAQLQHITYREFLPIIVGNEMMKKYDLKPLGSGYKKQTYDPNDLENDPTIANHFASAAFRFAHTLLPGLMRMTDAEKGTSSYVELHRMLFNPYSLYAENGIKRSVNSATTNVIQKYSTHVTSQLTSNLFEDPVANFTIPCGLDLVSLNIQRGRDHGLPGYTVWREYCGLGKVETFDDLEGYLNHQDLEQISMLYESVDDIDVYTGALSEIPESDSLVGPTFTCLIIDQFARLQKGDRFWYEYAEQPYPFTEEQLVELRKSSLAKIICDCSDGITHAQMELMHSVGPDNPMVSCKDIPEPSFTLWKENISLPI